MSTRLRVPVHARMIDRHSGISAEGRAFTLRLWEGSASHGYATDYQPIPKRWLEIETRNVEKRGRIVPVVFDAYAYSGKRYAKAVEDFARIKRETQPAAGAVLLPT